LDFDAHPQSVLDAARAGEEDLRRGIIAARLRLASLPVTSDHLSAVAAICSEQHLDGIRGDLAVIKTARALAAWEGAVAVSADHLRRAASFALSHRLRRRPGVPRSGRPSLEAVPLSQPTESVLETPAAAPGSLDPSAPISVKLTTDLIDPDSSGRR